MLPPYSTSFIGRRFTVALPVTDYTVPAGKVAVVDSVSFVQDVNTAATILAASVDLTGSGAFTIFFSSVFPITAVLNSRTSAYWQGRIAIRAGGVLRIQTLGGTNGYGIMSGFLLDA